MLITMDTCEGKEVFKKYTMYETLRQNAYNTDSSVLNNGLVILLRRPSFMV